MICGYCGQESSDGARFCKYCGAPMTEGQQPTTEGGQASAAGQQFAPGAQETQQGSYYQQFYDQGHQPVQPVKKKKKWIPAVIIAAVAVVGLIVLLGLLRGGMGGGRPEATIAKFEAALNEMNIERMVECVDSASREQMREYFSSDAMEGVGGLLGMFSGMVDFDLKVTGLDYTDSTHCQAAVNMGTHISAFGYDETQEQQITIPLIKEAGGWFIDGTSVDDWF